MPEETYSIDDIDWKQFERSLERLFRDELHRVEVDYVEWLRKGPPSSEALRVFFDA